jgi:hypothetical protein
MDSNFLSALGRWGGRHGPGDRTAAMRALFGGLLPDELLGRTTKARFDRVFLGSEARAFAEAWDGSGLDLDVIDVDGLRAELAQPMPRSGVGPLLQWLWVSRQEPA